MSSAVHARAPEAVGGDSALSIWSRRALTIPLVFAAALGALLAAPLWVPLAVLIDLPRRPPTALRCALFFTLYLWCEVAGVLASAGIWLASGLPGAARNQRCQRWSFTLQHLWARALFHGPARIFGFRMETEGSEVLASAPMLLFLRHASVADTLLPPLLVSHPHGIRLRYVLKRELLWDPCLDIVGQRLPNYFARRDSSDSELERQGVAQLARDLGDREGVMIYPEGTRFTEAKRGRILERLRSGGHSELHERAAALERVLPPRLGGPLALLEASPGVDVVFGAHSGFDRAGTFWDLWNGGLCGAVIRARFWRVPASEVPSGREARVEWLYEQWGRVDRSVGELREGRA